MRHGDTDDERDISTFGADIVDPSGVPTSFAALRNQDLVQVSGMRSDPGDSFSLDTFSVDILRRDVKDDCDNPV